MRSVRAVLSVIAKRHCINVFRKKCKQTETLAYDDLENIIADEESENIELIDAIKQLGEPDSQIFIRKYYLGQKNIDIAKDLNMNISTLNMRISRGLKKLKKNIGGWYVMKERLNALKESISLADAEMLSNELGSFDENYSLTADEQQRILSSVMRKAGFEMNETNVKVTKGKKRFGKMMIFGIAAAAVLSAVGWTAVSGGFERVKEFFHQDISPYADMINENGKSVANDDITLSIDGVIMDEVQCRVVVSLASKTKHGEEILEQLNNAIYYYNEDCAKLGEKAKQKRENGMNADEAHEWYLEQIGKLSPHKNTLYFENAGKTSEDHADEELTVEEARNIDWSSYFPANGTWQKHRNSKYHFYEMFTIEMIDLDRSQPLILRETESGLSIEIDLNEYFGSSPTALDSHRLVSDDPNAFDYVVISPLAIYIRATQNDIDNGRILKDSSELTSVIVNYTDGTSEKLDGISISKSVEWGDGLPEFDNAQERYDYLQEHMNEQTVTDETLEASGKKLFSLDRISSVIIDGVTYTIDVK